MGALVGELQRNENTISGILYLVLQPSITKVSTFLDRNYLKSAGVKFQEEEFHVSNYLLIE